MNGIKKAFRYLAFAVLCSACNHEVDLKTDTLFTLIPATHSGITFRNDVKYTEELNCYTFRNFYNGGGVGVGDFNNDGLQDLFFCGNMTSNRLYLNRGNFQFEDITEKAGVGSRGVWSSGVAVADVNGDGWLDLYVCKSGPPGGEQRHNELFINNGVQSSVGSPQSATFTEKSKEYGIADEGLSVHAAFFDYDLDGDLDLYLLNNSLRSVGGYDLIKDQRNIPDPQGGNKLYRNDGGRFTDVTQQSGIFSSNIGFGLGVAVSDLNFDGAPDLFVSNDFFERDYLYFNNGKGVFTESLESCIRETSMGSMGADIADLNNDGWPEIFVTEMLPEDDRRIKTKTKFEHWDLYQQEVKNGYYHQFTRNTLQLNLGIGESSNASNSPIPQFPNFLEISRLAGVHATDWSWGALIFDMDNDGWKDIFVANGIGKDLTDQDYVNFYSDPENVKAVIRKEGKAITKLVDAMPSEKIPNYAFQNQSAVLTSPSSILPLYFINKAAEWGLGEPSFSNGSAYADFDNDGDLDFVVNNQDMPPFLYRNNADTLLRNHRFLNLQLIGEGKNTQAIGAKVIIRQGEKVFYQENSPMRGFESTVDSRLHFGFGLIEKVEKMTIVWPDGRVKEYMDVPTNQFLKLYQKEATAGGNVNPLLAQPESKSPVFRKVTPALSLDYQHMENEYDDFDRDRLIFHMLSTEGPKTCRHDVNGDGLEDFFIGGAKDSPGALFIQTSSPGGAFRKTNTALFENDKGSEDLGCTFFDADGDGDPDLYVASGGSEFSESASALADRLYFNDGKGHFTKSKQLLPAGKFENTSCVAAADYDADGDQDLFVGVRLIPFYYGVPGNGYLLQNDGKGNFKNVTAQAAPALSGIGMMTDAAWADFDGDKDPDLVLAGEYLPLTILINNGGTLNPHPSPLSSSSGWWNCLTISDLDGDGDLDIAAGNHGLNSRFKASPEKPATMWVNDFDQNGSAEQLVSIFNGEKSYPLALRNDLVAQMPFLKKQFLYFKDYANKAVEDIFSPEQLKKNIRLEAFTLESSIFLNDGKGNFERKALPVEAQTAPVYAIAAEDFDGDGETDLLLGGNLYQAKPETGIYDGSYGWLLKGDGKGGFTATTPARSGFFVRGAIRDFLPLKTKGKRWLLVAKNNDAAEVFEY